MMPLIYVHILIIIFVFIGTRDAKRRTCLRGSVAQFRCSDDECIDSEWVCDGVYDCDGGSDEMNCLFKACQRDHYKCSNGICIHDSQVCDEKIDCTDGSDERNCEEDPDLEPCMQRARPGPCRGFFPRYYYNKKTGQCEEFIYGGCHGNENNFRRKEDCESTCLSGED